MKLLSPQLTSLSFAEEKERVVIGTGGKAWKFSTQMDNLVQKVKYEFQPAQPCFQNFIILIICCVICMVVLLLFLFQRCISLNTTTSPLINS